MARVASLSEVPGLEYDEYGSRRPTDPFWFPSTLHPLTGLGLGLIEQTTPPVRKVQADLLQRWEEPLSPQLSPHAPIQNFLEHPEDMLMLQRQNDNLAQKIQDLERAKSLAAVTSAQSLQKIRMRQEQMRRETEQAVLRSKEMQADNMSAALGIPPSNEGRLHLRHQDPATILEDLEAEEQRYVQAHRQQQLLPQQQQPQQLQQLQELQLHQQQHQQHLQQQQMQHQPLQQHQQQRLQRLQQQEDDKTLPRSRMQQPRPRSNLLQQPDRDGRRRAKEMGQAPVRIATAGSSSSSSAVAATTDRPPWSQEAWEGRPEAPLQGPESDWLIDDQSLRRPGTEDYLQSYHEAKPEPLPAQDVLPGDISAMASLILRAHQPSGNSAAGHFPAPYVDALGNPLGPTTGPELPNIKDDVPAQPALARGNRVVEAAQNAGWPGPAGASGSTSARRGPVHEKVTSARDQATSRGSQPSEAANQSDREAPLPGHSQLQQQELKQQKQLQQELKQQQQVLLQLQQQQQQQQLQQDQELRQQELLQQELRQQELKQHELRQQELKQAQEMHQAHLKPAQSSAMDGSGGSKGSRARQESPDERPSRPSRRRDEGIKPTEESEALQAHLDECLDIIRVSALNCKDSLEGRSLKDLRNMNTPPAVVKDVLEAVALLLGQPETRWEKLRNFLTDKAFPDKIRKLRVESVNREQFKKLREKLSQPEFDEEYIIQVCVPVVPLAIWCRSIGVYLSKTKYKGGPDIRPVAGAAAPPQHVGRRPAVQPPAGLIIEPDLSKMSPEEVRHVMNLTISRPDVGSIVFHGETDCTALDFENIVRLEIGEVLVYPDPKAKPEPGQGLNKAATVTMYQCWPPNGSNVSQDLKGQERYKKKIKDMTESRHARFIDYDITRGIWTFGVAQF